MDQSRLLHQLESIARKKNVSIPDQPLEKAVALRENLVTLPGQVFDRAYTLAMVQDLTLLTAQYKTAATWNDADISAVARDTLPGLQVRLDAANALLKRLGGSPFK